MNELFIPVTPVRNSIQTSAVSNQSKVIIIIIILLQKGMTERTPRKKIQ